MKKVKILFLIIFLSFSGMIFVPAQGAVDADPPSIAIIFATGGLGDKSFNDAAYRGLQYANDSFEGEFTYKYVEPADIPAFSSFQDSLAKEDHDLIICIGFLQTSALNVTARTYTDKNFVLIDDVIDLPNVKSITFKEHEGSFLVGAMAAMTTENEKIGFLGGLDIYLINKFLAGYEQGAHYINENISITATYSPDPTNPWGDIAGGKSIGETFINQKNDVIFSAAGGTGFGVIQACNETDDVYAIGVDSDQDHLAPGKVLCSMLKKVETAVNSSIAEIVEASFTAGHKEFGIAEDGVGISAMSYTQAIKQGTYTFDGVSKSRWDWIEDIKAKIANGTIVVNDTVDDTKLNQLQTATPGFLVVPSLFLLAVVTVTVRKRRR